MCTQVWSPAREQIVSLRSPSLSLFLVYPWCVQFQPCWLWPPTSPSCWNPLLFEGQWWCKHDPCGAPVSLFSLPMAFGQWLPALAPFLCSKVWRPKVLAHLHSCFLHLFTPWAHASSTTVPPNQQPLFLLTLQTHALRAHYKLLTVTFDSADTCTAPSSVRLGAFHLHGTGISRSLRWASLSLPASFSWSGSHSTQVRSSTLCPRKFLPAWELQLSFPLNHPISSEFSWVPTSCERGGRIYLSFCVQTFMIFPP